MLIGNLIGVDCIKDEITAQAASAVGFSRFGLLKSAALIFSDLFINGQNFAFRTVDNLDIG